VVDAQCHEGDWALCERQADLLIEGEHLERDLPDAGYHLALACQEGVASACARAGDFLAEGGDAALADDCADGEALSCLVLGTLRLEAEGPAIDAARRREIDRSLERACTLGMPEACRFLEARRP
jgi:TPR repeat protein